MKTIIPLLIVALFAGCQTALPVKVPGLIAAENKPQNCNECAKLVEKAVKESGHNAAWVSLPQGKRYHAICVFEHEGKIYAYDSQFRSKVDLRIPPSQVFDGKGAFIGDVAKIHQRARPIHDFYRVQWSNGLNTDLRGGLF